MAMLDAAHSDTFSSERAVGGYCEEIWGVQPVTAKR
jgi:glucan phosphorylase